MPIIRFYVPDSNVPPFDKFTTWVDEYGLPSQENNTLQNWNFQTWYHLSRAGFDCTRTSDLPSDGILLSTWVPDLKQLWNRPDVFVVGIAADGEAWPSAQMTVVQNPQMHDVSKGHYFIPHWPQPGIIPRNDKRGDQIENLHYFGVPGNLANEFHEREFAEALLRETGVRFSFMPPEQWHNFSETDLVLAVRGLDASEFKEKPATKLYNAWIAGVPAICGRESSMVQSCNTSYDASFCRSVSDVIEFVGKLKQQPELYRILATCSRQRGDEFCVSATTKRWEKFLLEAALPSYREWQKQPLNKRRIWLAQRRVSSLRQRFVNKFFRK
jgi:hypothetical protein